MGSYEFLLGDFQRNPVPFSSGGHSSMSAMISSQKILISQEETGENDAAPAANDTPAQGPTVTRKDLISKKEDVQINALR